MGKLTTTVMSTKIIFYFLFALFYSYFLGYTMYDDGLRHIAFAAHPDIMKSWGDVYPHSLFSSYDPWHAWHFMLRILLQFVPYEYAHIAINTFFIFFVALWCELALNKFISKNLGSTSVLLALSITYLSARYLNIRPDNLSGLFVMYALLLPNSFLAAFTLTIIYSPTYYLFYFYTGIIGLLWLLTKNYRAFFGVFTATIIGLGFHLYNDGEEFIKISSYLLSDQTLRDGLNVSELVATIPLFEYIPNILSSVFLLSFATISVIWLEKRKPQTLPLYFMFLSSFMWMLAARYYELFFPVMLISILYILKNVNIDLTASKIKSMLSYCATVFNEAKNSPLFFVPAILAVMLAYAVIAKNDMSATLLQGYSFFKEKRFDNKVILFNSMSIAQYFALYQNPTLHFVPSCSIGWFDKSNPRMRSIYIRMQKENGISEEELRDLATYLKADYYFHTCRNFKQQLDLAKLKSYGFEPQSITSSMILFKINRP